MERTATTVAEASEFSKSDSLGRDRLAGAPFRADRLDCV